MGWSAGILEAAQYGVSDRRSTVHVLDLSELRFTTDEKYLAWSFAFIFSPSVSVLLVGQSSLLVLFAALLTMVLYHRRKTWSAGLSLALTLTKPHLTVPLVLLLLFRRQFKITAIGLSMFAALGIVGLYIGHSDVNTYLQGLRSYAASNRPTNPRLVGIQNLTTVVFGAPESLATLVSVLCGILFVGLTLQIGQQNVFAAPRRGCTPVAPARKRRSLWGTFLRFGTSDTLVDMVIRKCE